MQYPVTSIKHVQLRSLLISTFKKTKTNQRRALEKAEQKEQMFIFVATRVNSMCIYTFSYLV